MKFVKYNKFWWQYDDSTPKNKAKLINLVGGYNTGNDITNCEIVEAKSFEDLNWYGTTIYDDKYPYGWLDRNGKFYGCDFKEHSLQAELVHHSDRRKLEKEGWIHISKDMIYNTGKLVAEFWGSWKNGVLPTDSQLLYLSKHPQIDSSQVVTMLKWGLQEQEEQNL